MPLFNLVAILLVPAAGLGLLLFAGALHLDLGDLARQKVAIAVLATVGVALSTLVVGRDPQRGAVRAAGP